MVVGRPSLRIGNERDKLSAADSKAVSEMNEAAH
jgi:hypothetical protein